MLIHFPFHSFIKEKGKKFTFIKTEASDFCQVIKLNRSHLPPTQRSTMNEAKKTSAHRLARTFASSHLILTTPTQWSHQHQSHCFHILPLTKPKLFKVMNP